MHHGAEGADEDPEQEGREGRADGRRRRGVARASGYPPDAERRPRRRIPQASDRRRARPRGTPSSGRTGARTRVAQRVAARRAPAVTVERARRLDLGGVRAQAPRARGRARARRRPRCRSSSSGTATDGSSRGSGARGRRAASRAPSTASRAARACPRAARGAPATAHSTTGTASAARPRRAVTGESTRPLRHLVGADVVGVAVAAAGLVRDDDVGPAGAEHAGQPLRGLVERRRRRTRPAGPSSGSPARPVPTPRHAGVLVPSLGPARPCRGSTWSRTPSAASAAASSWSRCAASAGPSPSRWARRAPMTSPRSPRVQVTTVTGRPAAAQVASSAPVASVSSSGCACTARSPPRPSHGRRRAVRRASSVP